MKVWSCTLSKNVTSLHCCKKTDNYYSIFQTYENYFCTYKAMLVREVIGELELVEGDNLLHPLLPTGRTVRVDVHPLRHLGVRLPCHDPPTKIKSHEKYFYSVLS